MASSEPRHRLPRGFADQLGRRCCRPPGDRPGERKWDGWWEAIVLARDGDMLTLKWRDYPWQPNVQRHAGSVALLKPSPVST